LRVKGIKSEVYELRNNSNSADSKCDLYESADKGKTWIGPIAKDLNGNCLEWLESKSPEASMNILFVANNGKDIRNWGPQEYSQKLGGFWHDGLRVTSDGGKTWNTLEKGYNCEGFRVGKDNNYNTFFTTDDSKDYLSYVSGGSVWILGGYVSLIENKVRHYNAIDHIGNTTFFTASGSLFKYEGQCKERPTAIDLKGKLTDPGILVTDGVDNVCFWGKSPESGQYAIYTYSLSNNEIKELYQMY